MSVLIKGMQIPENCMKCGLMCALRHFNILNDNRPDGCPLIELPEHHGRLIDADDMRNLWAGCSINGSILPLLDARPTIVEAE